MTQFLPPNLLALFAPRDPIPFKSPVCQLTWEKDRERTPYTGVGQLVHLFEDPKDTPAPTRGETKEEKKKRRIKEKAVIRVKELEKEVKNWDPHGNKTATGDAFKTLFVARINYDTSESKLRREFETYGPIRKIRMVQDVKNGKPRGYAFIEYEHERDMHTAYKSADGKKIDKRRVIVDVERGRTVKGWRPRRLGGGMGGTRRAANEDTKSRERERSREKERGAGGGERERQRKRSRSRERERKKRSRSRDRDRRDRDRGDRDRRRDKDRPDRERDRDRKRDKGERSTDTNDEGRGKDRDRKHRHRDRSRERERDGKKDRERRRSRDRDRGRSDRDKSEDVKSSAKTEESNGYSSNSNIKMENEEQSSYTNNNDYNDTNDQGNIKEESGQEDSKMES